MRQQYLHTPHWSSIQCRQYNKPKFHYADFPVTSVTRGLTMTDINHDDPKGEIYPTMLNELNCTYGISFSRFHCYDCRGHGLWPSHGIGPTYRPTTNLWRLRWFVCDVPDFPVTCRWLPRDLSLTSPWLVANFAVSPMQTGSLLTCHGNFSNHLDTSQNVPETSPQHVSRGRIGEVGVMEFGLYATVLSKYRQHVTDCFIEHRETRQPLILPHFHVVTSNHCNVSNKLHARLLTTQVYFLRTDSFRSTMQLINSATNH